MQFEEDVPHPPGTNGVDFQRKQFIAERFGWLAMASLLVWALLGGFGDGWMSDRQVRSDAETCTLDYQRFGRRDAPCELRMRLRADVPKDQVAVRLNRGFVDRVRIERVTPAYRSMVGDADGVTMLFDVEPADGVRTFSIEYKPQHVGTLRVAVRPAGEDELTFDQFIFP
jgi:hypothetical protein